MRDLLEYNWNGLLFCTPNSVYWRVNDSDGLCYIMVIYMICKNVIISFLYDNPLSNMIGCLLFNLFSMVISVPTTSSSVLSLLSPAQLQQIEDLGIVHVLQIEFQNLGGNDLYYERNAAADPLQEENTCLYGDICLSMYQI